MDDNAEAWFDQLRAVSQLVQLVGVVAGRFGRRWVFEPDHVSGLGGADPGNLGILCGWRTQ